MNLQNILEVDLNIINKQKQVLLAQDNLYLGSYQELIVGRWRGYYEKEDFTMYYMYEFLANGHYIARHRVYQKKETIQDITWRGSWKFDGQTVFVQGTSETAQKLTVQLKFNLAEHWLYYQEGSLAQPYLPLRMGKIN